MMTTSSEVQSILKRTTFIVSDAEKAANFYEEVFGWTRWYDNRVEVHANLVPATPANALAHLVIMRARDPAIGMLAFMQYVNASFEAAVPIQRNRLRSGAAILVIETTEIEAVHERAQRAGASIVAAPTHWEVPAPRAGERIQLCTMSCFDPNGIFLEINLRRSE